MRRFIKTFTVHRHIQITVVQDGEKHRFELIQWAAEFPAPEVLKFYHYRAEDPSSMDAARIDAIREAERLYWAERGGRLAMRQTSTDKPALA